MVDTATISFGKYLSWVYAQEYARGSTQSVGRRGDDGQWEFTVGNRMCIFRLTARTSYSSHKRPYIMVDVSRRPFIIRYHPLTSLSLWPPLVVPYYYL